MQLTTFARRMNIHVRTLNKWVVKDPSLAFMKTGVKGGKAYWLRLDRLADKKGIPLHVMYGITTRFWLKATELAAYLKKPRKTVWNWCKANSRFGFRLGHTWYIDLESLGMSWDDARDLFRKVRGTENCGPVDDEDM